MKTILITGATDGIGLVTAKRLAKEGHALIVHGRSVQKVDAVVDEIVASGGIANGLVADLSDLSQAQQLVTEVKANYGQLDVILNNAGVYKVADPSTASGIDLRFVVNTLSPYLITIGLLPILAEDGRIVNLSSAAQAPIDLDALAGNKSITDQFQAYAQSKLAITIWSQELAHKLKPNQVIVAVNPGSLLASKMVKEGFGLAGNDISIGADILVKAALAEEFKDASGKYFDNDSRAFAAPHQEASDPQKCAQVMTLLSSIIPA